MTQDLPIACSLNASDLRAWLDEIGALGRDALLDRSRRNHALPG